MSHDALRRVEKLVEAGRNSAKTNQGCSQIDSFTICTQGYSEPGYSDPSSGIIVFGNFNAVTRYTENKFVTLDDTPARLAKLLEKLGCELEWSDEWTWCDQCGKAVRSKPDSYSWRPYYMDDGCGSLICGDCVHEDPAPYLLALEGRDDACLTLDVDLEEAGYQVVEDGFEHGLFGGQSADPRKIAAGLAEQDVCRFLFKLDYNRQFDTGFSLWIHSSEVTKLDQEQFAEADKDGPDPAVNLRAALQDANRQMDRLDGQIKVATCDLSTGRATAKVISPEAFIEGRAFDN